MADMNNLWQEYQAAKQQPDLNALWAEYQATKSSGITVDNQTPNMIQALNSLDAPDGPMAMPQNTGFNARMEQDLARRTQQFQDIGTREASGMQSPYWRPLDVAGIGLGAFSDILGSEAGSAARYARDLVPQPIDDAVVQGGQYAARGLSKLGQNLAENTQGGQNIGELLVRGQTLAEENPDIMAHLGALFNVGAAIPAVRGAQTTVDTGLNIGSQALQKGTPIARDIGKSIAINTPKNALGSAKGGSFTLGGAETGVPLLDVNRSTMFSRKPNAYEVGLNANKAISKAYDEASTKVNNLYGKVRENAVDVPAGDFMPKINGLINSLKGKVAEGSKEAKALSFLEETRDNILKKATPADLVTSSRPQVKTINASDLLDIRRALNEGLPNNKFFKSGEGTLANFKTYTSNLLKRAGEQNPKFQKALTAADKAQTEISTKFTKNKSIKPFWEPEDYYSYKRGLNNPEHIELDTTTSRANTFIDNLNTSKAGNITAVMNALPEGEAKKVLRAAIIRAKKFAPSGAKVAGAQLIAGKPLGATKTLATSLFKTQDTPITEFARNLKKVGKQ